MNRLSKEQRVRILAQLVEGSSLRSISRVEDISINTVTKLLVDLGRVSGAYHDKVMMGIKSKRIEVDEIWSFNYCREKNKPKTLKQKQQVGNIWTWVAIDPDTKLIPCWHVGGRENVDAGKFIWELSQRVLPGFTLNSDGYKAYLKAVDFHYGTDINYGIVVKNIGAMKKGGRQQLISIDHRVISGAVAKISTSCIERQNLTMRTNIKRFTRKTNAHSKKLQNHKYAIALHYLVYNFVRIHSSLRVTPAMEAGICDHVWELGDVIDLLDKDLS